MKDYDYKLEDDNARKNFQITKDAIEGAQDAVAVIISSGAGAPSSSVTTWLYVDTDNDRLYVKVGSTYKYASLT